MQRRALFLLALCLFFGTVVWASEEKIADISLADLKTAIADKKVVLLDGNGSEKYAKQHIPGALDFAAIKDDLAKKLPADKGALIVGYCGIEKCEAHETHPVAEAVAKLGYTNYKHFAPGIKGWIEAKEKVESSTVEEKKAEAKAGDK